MTNLTVGYLKRLLENLPDETSVCMCDFDESHLHCDIEQVQINGGHLLFVPCHCYEVWQEDNFDGIDVPIPKEWRD